MDEHTGSFLEQYIELLGNPAHWAFELTVQFVIDLVILYFGYKVIFKKIILPKIRKDIHTEIDRDHDLTHEEQKHAVDQASG